MPPQTNDTARIIAAIQAGTNTTAENINASTAQVLAAITKVNDHLTKIDDMLAMMRNEAWIP